MVWSATQVVAQKNRKSCSVCLREADVIFTDTDTRETRCIQCTTAMI